MTPGAAAARDGDAVLDALATSVDGLGHDEAAARLERYGPNALARRGGVRAPVVLLRQFKSPLIFILVGAALLSLALDEPVDAAVIAAVLVFNAIVGFFQEYRAERSLEALRALATTTARVRRGGALVEADATTLVPGDVVLLEAGDKVPADCRVLREAALEADESLLTGESATVAKQQAPVPADSPVADRRSILHMGTAITRGHARAVVVATGAGTELGRVAGDVGEIGEGVTPLQERMAGFTRLIGIAAFGAALLGLAIGAAQNDELSELVRAMVALLVAALPEGLPIVLTITLAISVSRMAREGAIVRRLPAVETLGSCTVIGSDKTGTLTQNRMTVQRILAGGQEIEVTGIGYELAGELRVGGAPARPEPGGALERTLAAGVLASVASVVPGDEGGEPRVTGDPTEIALVVSAAKAGLTRASLVGGRRRAGDIPFDSVHRYAATFYEDDDGVTAYVKGAPEAVLAMCSTAADGEPFDPEALQAAADALAAQGLRVLAMATARVPPAPAEELARSELGALEFAGLQGMLDPPRETAKAAVEGCRRAGIRTVMITGDHSTTGLAIARSLGIAGTHDRVLTGAELDALDDAALDAVIGEVPVYARVAPEHKLRLVRALQRRGETVAVTGDGVNDAPALKQADIGAAMGRTGTDVAKEAADMVVTDDDFATIHAAVEEGRIAFDNVRKTTFFLVSGNAAAVLAVLLSLGLGWALPFVAVQLLWLNLVTNGVQDLALAFEPGEPGIGERPPRRRGEGVMSALLWERTLIAAVVIAAGTLAVFRLALEAGDSIEEARTIALTTMVLFQAMHAGNARSEERSVLRMSPWGNRFLLLGTIAAVLLHALVMYVPPAAGALHLEPLDLWLWPVMAAVALSVVAAVELHKLLRRRRRHAP